LVPDPDLEVPDPDLEVLDPNLELYNYKVEDVVFTSLSTVCV
jgi:hypothetical protein